MKLEISEWCWAFMALISYIIPLLVIGRNMYIFSMLCFINATLNVILMVLCVEFRLRGKK